MIDFKKIKKVHLIGVGGIGMSALAAFLIHDKKTVSGSDLFENENTVKLINLGAKIIYGPHEAKNLPKNTEMVIFSSAVTPESPERLEATKNNIPQFDYHEALGMLTAGSKNLIVTGTHGKTTTTAMLASILINTKFDPNVLVGSNTTLLDGNYRVGAGNYYVLEGDEYKRGVEHLNPSVILLNNVEWDHPDVYPTESSYFRMFQDFVNTLPSDGLFVCNADDRLISDKFEMPSCKVSKFGIKNTQADLVAKNIKIAHSRQIFKLVYKGVELKDFNLKIPGTHNIYNALGASLVALEMGVDQDTIKDALATFPGTKRRFEVLGELEGAVLISDYAHHPTEVEATLKGVKEFYEGSRIIAYFQPHQKARTFALLNDFARVLDAANVDEIILNEIYDVPGRSDDLKISSKDIIKKMKKKIEYVPNFEEGFKLIKKRLKPKTVILIMGAGDIDASFRKNIQEWQ